MTELTVLCEGPSEVGFVDRLLRPHLMGQGIFVRRSVELNRQNFGVVSYAKLSAAWKGEIGRARGHQFVTTMIDLYALPKDYPGHGLRAENALERVRAIEREMKERMPSTQWLPHIQLHEFEALVYVDLNRIPEALPGADLRAGIDQLQADTFGKSPEEINDGPETAPSKRLRGFLPAYAKAQAGPAILEAIGLSALRAGCPHFDEWIKALESLAG